MELSDRRRSMEKAVATWLHVVQNPTALRRINSTQVGASTRYPSTGVRGANKRRNSHLRMKDCREKDGDDFQRVMKNLRPNYDTQHFF